MLDLKPDLRKELARRRDDLGADFRADASKIIARDAVEKFCATGLITDGPGPVVSGFYPFRSELDCRPLLSALITAGCQTALPVIVAAGQPLEFRQWAPGEPLEDGVWNIPVPAIHAATVVPDILLVPLLGFDKAGYRIGYGGGFYDRTLASLGSAKQITAIGLAFAVQEIDEVPREAHDVPLDWILTEAGLIRTGE